MSPGLSQPTLVGMSRVLHGGVLAAFFALVVAACGGSGGTPVVAGEPIGLEELAQAASSSADAASGRFAFSMKMSFPGADDPFAFSGSGAFDAHSGRASFTVDMSSFARLLGGFFAGMAGPNATDAPDFGDPEGWKIDAVQDGLVTYVRFPALAEQLPAGKSWIRTDGRGTGGSQGLDFMQFQQFTGTDPRKMLDFLQAVSGEIDVLGMEELRGVETTHYRATIDPLDYAKLAPPDKQQELGSLLERMASQPGLGEIPVDIWVDEGGLVRKLAMEISATEAGTSGAGEVSLAFELYDYGDDVEIDLPPASEVVDASAVRS